MNKERKYRRLLRPKNMVSFRVVVKETDLYVHAARPLEDVTRESILKHRGYLEGYIYRHPEFFKTLKPWYTAEPVPRIVKDMIAAGQKAGVGPMAAVAGAVAEHVGSELLAHTDQVIVENGGDLFIKTNRPVTVGIFAAESPLSLRIGLRIDSKDAPVAVCTSSGTVGHSLSFGRADAVCVVSGSCSLADAVATSVGNLVTSKSDIQKAVDFGKKIEGIVGLAVILADAIGISGDLELVPLELEKG